MSKEYNKQEKLASIAIRVNRRREEVAYLYFQEDLSASEIAEWSTYSLRTIKNDIAYIKAHKEEFSIY